MRQINWATSYDSDIQNRPSLDMVEPEISVPAIIDLPVLIAVYLFMLIGLCVLNITQVQWAGSQCLCRIENNGCAVFLIVF